MPSTDTPDISLVPLWLGLAMAQSGYISYIVYASLKAELITEFTLHAGMDAAEFEYFYGLIFSAYAVPNLIMPFAAGVLIDRVGATTVLMTCSFVVAMGIGLQCGGVSFASCWLTLLGRVILGIGVETIYFGGNVFCSEFLPVELLSMSGGIVAAALSVSLSIGSMVAVPIFQHGGTVGLNLALAFNAVVVIAGVFILIRHRGRYEAITERASDREPSDSEVEPLVVTQPLQKAESQLVREDADMLAPECVSRGVILVFVCIVLGSMSNTVCVFSFSSIYTSVFSEIWPLPPGSPMSVREQHASNWLSFFQFAQAVACPLIGRFVSESGGPGIAAFLGMIFQSMGHCIYATAARTPGSAHSYGPLLPTMLVATSVGYVAPVLTQCIVLIVPDKHTAKACGFLAVAQNISMAFFPMLVAYLRNSSGDYRSTTWAFSVAGGLGLVATASGLVADSIFGQGALSTLTPWGLRLLRPWHVKVKQKSVGREWDRVL